ncbi:MAG: hypothetical protein J2P54_01115 [Bradyrhizobiaceae bacterium]|nr:hypothetical protein [Bradyrhizobiaceae bacterium]
MPRMMPIAGDVSRFAHRQALLAALSGRHHSENAVMSPEARSIVTAASGDARQQNSIAVSQSIHPAA